MDKLKFEDTTLFRIHKQQPSKLYNRKTLYVSIVIYYDQLNELFKLKIMKKFSLFLAVIFVIILMSACKDKTQSFSEVKSTEITHLPKLHQAIIENDFEKVKRLIETGADVNQLDKLMGNSPLHIAAQLDNPKIIEYLINKGAFVNLQAPKSGHTPLMVAAWYSKPENIKTLLLAVDINVNARSPHGGSTAKDMIGGWDQTPNKRDLQRNKELTLIFDQYEKEFEKRIADQKIYQLVISKEYTEDEKVEKIKKLIEAGENVNTESFVIGTGNDRHSPLLVAARENYVKIVKLLLDAGASIGQRGYIMNAIAFHKAAYMGNPRVMELLLENKETKKYLNDQGPNNGYTPLHDAIWHGNTETARLLIEAGARLDLKTYEGDTPLDLAQRYQYHSIVNLLKNKDQN